MKINTPFYTPKQIIETNKLMRDVWRGTAVSRFAKQRRHDHYLAFSQLGYRPEQPQKKLHQMLGNLIQNIKCKFSK